MLTQDRIEQVRRQTSVSVMDAVHALTLSAGDVDRAIDGLNDHTNAGNRAVIAGNRGHAQRIAAALVDSGIWFECETTAGGQWRFCVALGAYARLCALNAALGNDAVPA
ncbi:MAG: hypothetical protein P4L92_03395 [Rudaea sp.]|nr:hypothetical protein [Rudaea sp.]